MKMTIEMINKIKSLHDNGKSGLEISRLLHGDISYKSIIILFRANFNLTDYLKIQNSKNKCKLGTIPTWFENAMMGYTDDEIRLSYKQFQKPAPIFDVVKCRCTESRMCYPHYLQYLENLYVHGIKA